MIHGQPIGIGDNKPRKRARKAKSDEIHLPFEIHHESIGDGKSNIWRGDGASPTKHVVSFIVFGTLVAICRLLNIPLVDKTPNRR